jgi:hypothetical protein
MSNSNNKEIYDYLKNLIARSSDSTVPSSVNVLGVTFNAPRGQSSSTFNQGRRKVKKSSTVVVSNSLRPIIVKDTSHKEKYKILFPSEYPKLTFEIRKGEGNPDSYVEKYKTFLKSQPSLRIILKSNQLGNGGDISANLYNVLINLYKVLSSPKYSNILPITITGGNDQFHQGKTLNPNSTYGNGRVKPYTTTHTRGLAIDVRSVNVTIDNLIINALEEAGFTGILYHDPPHIHANIQ